MIFATLKARALAWVTGIASQAIAVAMCAALVTGFVWWLRYDARMDERRTWEARMKDARIAEQIKAMARERRRQEAARLAAEAAAVELATAEAARAEAEARLLELRKARVIVWPKDVVRAINK